MPRLNRKKLANATPAQIATTYEDNLIKSEEIFIDYLGGWAAEVTRPEYINRPYREWLELYIWANKDSDYEPHKHGVQYAKIKIEKLFGVCQI